MTRDPDFEMPRIELEPGYSISRVINGCWQLTPDHSAKQIDRHAVVDSFLRAADAGLTTFDCADIYTGVENLLGDFRRAWRAGGRDPDRIQIHTKYVPDVDSLPGLGKAAVDSAIERSLTRLGVERLDLVQFHWWDHGVPGFVDTARHLRELKDAGKIRCLGLTNVGVAEAEALANAGIAFTSNQVQYSLLDRRPEHGMVGLCDRKGSRLLCYGSLAGGFLSDRYLGRTPPLDPQANRSLVKYRLIVDECGGWTALQSLLTVLASIARKHEVSVANVAARWVLDRTGVAAVILGASRADRLDENRRLFAFELDDPDRSALSRLGAGHTGPAGDIYELERDRSGPHWAILRTGLHAD